MAGPIYKVFMGRPLVPWYQLSPEEQQALLAKVDEAFKQAGGKRLVVCDSSWSSDNWRICGVEEFPDIEAVQRFTDAVNQFNWYYYVESTSVLGTKIDMLSQEA